MKETVECAECGREIDDDYVSYKDNFLQREYFGSEDGSDNIFCSVECGARNIFCVKRKIHNGTLSP